MQDFLSFFERLAEAKRMSNLFSMSDAELARRGFSREGLKRHYIDSFSAR